MLFPGNRNHLATPAELAELVPRLLAGLVPGMEWASGGHAGSMQAKMARSCSPVTGIFVQIKTGNGMRGRVAKKNWSTPIFNEMMKLLKEGNAKSPFQQRS